MQETIEQLRQRIEAKYSAAMSGLDAIADFLGGSDLPVVSPKPPQNGASNRDSVFAVMDDRGWHTIKDITRKTELGGAGVRGVVYAPSLQDKFKKRKRGKTVSFKLAAEKG
ncbi:MAG: hypothetical protein IID41_10005 [Planctomycetes bacterium]|nr:hypothetical protein [Planctomycetota bacterium]